MWCCDASDSAGAHSHTQRPEDEGISHLPLFLVMSNRVLSPSSGGKLRAVSRAYIVLGAAMAVLYRFFRVSTDTLFNSQ